jgi:hypothetical protein
MNKQVEAKTAQGYQMSNESICSKCKHFSSGITIVKTVFASWDDEKNLRCTLGNFSVKKTATCKQFEVKA